MTANQEMTQELGLPIDHLGIAVEDLETATIPYRFLGLSQVGAEEVIVSQSVRVRVLQAGPNLIELLEPTSPASPIAHFLRQRGPGLHHLAFRVNDLEGELARLSADGALLIDATPRPGRAGTRVAFLHPRWTKGVLVELVEHG